jgi:hypothetical protein
MVTGSPLNKSMSFNLVVSTGTVSIALSFDGKVADRVGQSELAQNPDGQGDGVFTVTLNPGSGNRTVTRLHLTNSAGGIWNTVGGDGFWTLGAASGLGTALLNAPNDSVNFAVTDGGSFRIFASDFQNIEYVNGTMFTLTANFAVGSTAQASTVISTGFDYTLSNSGNISISQGSSGSNTITATLVSGNSQSVSFSASGLPAGATANFTNNPCNPTCSSTLTISTSVFTSVGTFPITVTGSPLTNKTTSFNLVVGPVGTLSIALSFDGKVADRVGQSELAQNSDGQFDGVFTVTLNTGSGNRTVTRLHLTNSVGGIWNTVAGDGFWTLGAASGLSTALLNATNDSVNFAVTDGGSFRIFASDFQNIEYVNGTMFTLTANFLDGSTATANVTLP